jgi:hypothetical protein
LYQLHAWHHFYYVIHLIFFKAAFHYCFPQSLHINIHAFTITYVSCALQVSLLAPSSKSWQDIASLTQLRALALRRCTITAGGKRTASSSSSTFSSSSAEHAQECGSSTGSECTKQPTSPATEPDARCLAALQQLNALDCSGSSVDAAALATLQQLPFLQHVCLTRCQGVSNAVLGALGGCSRLNKLDLRLRGSGCSWSIKGLLPLLQQLPGLAAVYVSEVPAGLPQCEEGRVIACSTEQAPLLVARDVGLGCKML